MHSRREQSQVGDLVRDMGEFGVGAVGEDDDGEVLFGESGDAGGEADAIAAVPDFFYSTVIADEPAEAVTGIRMLGFHGRGESLVEQLWANEFAGIERLIP